MGGGALPLLRHAARRCWAQPVRWAPARVAWQAPLATSSPQRLSAHHCRLQPARGFASAATATDADEGEEPATEADAASWHAQATKAAKGGDLRAASILYEKALRARIELLGEDDMETDRTRHSLAATLEEELFHADWTVKAGLKSKLSWVMTAGLEDLDDPDYAVGGESDPVDPTDPLGQFRI